MLYFRHGDPGKYDMGTAQQLMTDIVSKVPDRDVISDLDSAEQFAARDGADSKRLGITGFCWGGRIVWLYAAHNPNLKAGVAWYGRLVPGAQTSPLQPKHPLDLVESLKAPVLGLYGAADTGIPVASVEKMKDALKAAGKPSEIVLYPDTPH